MPNLSPASLVSVCVAMLAFLRLLSLASILRTVAFREEPRKKFLKNKK